MIKQFHILGVSVFIILLLMGAVLTSIDDFFLPGSQAGESGNLESPKKCANCHGDYDESVEPDFNWKGNMMAQAARDPLYLASLAIANQDAPESGDLCIRCHSPNGWLNGRSEPTDGSALTDMDREGVQCDFCHRMVKPTLIDVNPFPNDEAYTSDTYQSDQNYLSVISTIPPQSGNGMYVVHFDNAKRGPYNDAIPKHQTFYSPYHRESDICGTCHDVSNPVYNKNEDGSYTPNALAQPSPEFTTYAMLPVERTYSEWKMSAFNSPLGVYSEVFGGNKRYVSTCQDCHMQDVSGYGANKSGIPFRDDLPLHDMTGGNTIVPLMVAQMHPDEVDVFALEAGINRATTMLQNAANIELVTLKVDDGYELEVKVINQTGHKLPSGYPEGRRMWINVQALDKDGVLVFESGAYDNNTAELNLDGTKVYEVKLGMSEEIATLASSNGNKQYHAGESFHFVLNDLIIKDNRIPPLGFTNSNFEAIQSPVVDYFYNDFQNWDLTTYTLPSTTDYVRVRLLYQTISKEFAEFLRDENYTNNAGQIFYDLYVTHGKSDPVVMYESDFFIDDIPTLMDQINHVKNNVKIYPNPTSDIVNVSFVHERDGMINIELYSMSGEKVKTLYDAVNDAGQFKGAFDFSEIAAGTYILVINRDYTYKLVVK